MGRGQFGCGYCNFRCDTNEETEIHYKSEQHIEYMKRWVCSSCHIQLYSANEWDKHLTTSKHKTNSNIMFSCDLCNYTTMDNQSMRRHNLSKKHLNLVNGVVKPPPKEYTCETCEYVTNVKNSLEVHLLSKTHQDAEKGIFKVKLEEYTCEACNYKTPFKQSLHTHTLSKKHRKNVELTASAPVSV